MRERRVVEEELEYLGPVAIAIFVELGWIRMWPMAWTKRGLFALSQGNGRWHHTDRQVLPLYAEPVEGGAAYWYRRRDTVPTGTNIPL